MTAFAKKNKKAALKAMKKAGKPAPPSVLAADSDEAAQMMSAMDLNGDGIVTFNEYEVYAEMSLKNMAAQQKAAGKAGL